MKKTTTKRASRKVASKKRRSNKAPSAKQLAARRKFALAAEAKKLSNPQDLYIVTFTRQDGPSRITRTVDAYAKSKQGAIEKIKSQILPRYPEAKGFTASLVHSRQQRAAATAKARKRNKTVIVKPKRVLVMNGKTTRRKAQTKARKATTSRLASRSLFRSVPLKKKRNPNVKELREKFTGTKSRKTAMMNAATGTPKNLAKLGKLILIKAEKATIKPSSGTTWLCADSKGKLHLATSAARLYDGPATNFGAVSQIEYEAIKPHLGHKRPTIFFHKMGEEGGSKPVLIGDGKGGLKFRGGSYKITREGIVN